MPLVCALLAYGAFGAAVGKEVTPASPVETKPLDESSGAPEPAPASSPAPASAHASGAREPHVDRGVTTRGPVVKPVGFTSSGESINAILTVPESRGRFPIVLLLHGYTGNLREVPVAGTGEHLYERTARIFGERGLASLRFDFRGSGKSGGNWPETTFSGQAQDVSAAMAWLRSSPLIDSGRVALLGFSQGGLVALRSAARNPQVDALVLWNPVTDPVGTYGRIFGSRKVLYTGFESARLGRGGVVGSTGLKPMFFFELFNSYPIADASEFRGPMLIVSGKRDALVSPPGELANLIRGARGNKQTQVKLLNADHVFSSSSGRSQVDQAIEVSATMLVGALGAGSVGVEAGQPQSSEMSGQ